jgi:site-specific DNA recombinase
MELFSGQLRKRSGVLSEIASQLNQECFTTQQDKLFTKVQVKRILDRKEFYAGQYQYGGITAIGLHQAIL